MRVSPRAFDRQIAGSLKPIPPQVDEIVNFGVLLADTIDAERIAEQRQSVVSHGSTYSQPAPNPERAATLLMGSIRVADQLSELIPIKDRLDPAFLAAAAHRVNVTPTSKYSHLTQSPPFDARLYKHWTAVEQRVSATENHYKKFEVAGYFPRDPRASVEDETHARDAVVAYAILKNAGSSCGIPPNSCGKSREAVGEAITQVAATALSSKFTAGSVDARAAIEESLLNLRAVASEAFCDHTDEEIPLMRAAASFAGSEPIWVRPEMSFDAYQNAYKNIVATPEVGPGKAS